jgi:hypothetical protein
MGIRDSGTWKCWELLEGSADCEGFRLIHFEIVEGQEGTGSFEWRNGTPDFFYWRERPLVSSYVSS